MGESNSELRLLRPMIVKKRLRQTKSGLWYSESGEFNIESSPLRPYSSTFNDLIEVENDMKKRRKAAQKILGPG